MVRAVFCGREVAKVPNRFGWTLTGGTGGHRVFRYEHSETGGVRIVTVPMLDEISIGTLRDIADQCGADDSKRGAAG